MKNVFALIESILLPPSSPSLLSSLQIFIHFETCTHKESVSRVVKALTARSRKFYAGGNDVWWIDALGILWM